ncbi:MAG: anti-sigma F factor [Clostridia bacterium]
MKSKPVNKFKCTFAAKSVNEGFSRMLVASFVSQLDPRVNEVADIKTAVSEAVTNSIVHGYKNSELPPEKKVITLSGEYHSNGKVVITIRDYGSGIEDIKKAMEPLYTTDAENERSGMGFTIMESFFIN